MIEALLHCGFQLLYVEEPPMAPFAATLQAYQKVES